MNAIKLKEYIARVTHGAKLIVVSNREPCMHENAGGAIKAVRPASGMVTALEPIVRAVGGTWVAHGSGSADRAVVDSCNRIRLPEERPEYVLRRVWLSRKEEDGYYYGLSNEALWPLCHIVYMRPQFSRSDWEIYKNVNQRFCDAVLEEAEGNPSIIFIQDYHLALLPRLLRNSRPDLKIMQFWHIPWPNREAFRIFPWGEELLDGLLGNDILGFHIQYHCNNFLDTVDRGIEARVDYERFQVFRGGRPTIVRPFPISVDFEQIAADAKSSLVTARKKRLLKAFGEATSKTRLFVGADRIDYTKGIPERLRAFSLMLQRHPELHGKVTLVQLAAPSRTHIETYRNLNDELDDLVDEINWKHMSEDWAPVRLMRAHHDYYDVLAAHRLADVLLVTSLHDGMNLVAKEFIAARSDNDGVLLLSQYTGAAREFTDAVMVNPFDPDQLADALYDAYIMPETERTQRMRRMRPLLAKNTIYNWGAKFFETLECLPTCEKNVSSF
ncbi:MAG: trehalose-6-phosphate synthase [Deltaproteobacteria bacterium]|nr:trehalose-6-phosphate synthase [Deltaproteobacteria bacterium]